MKEALYCQLSGFSPAELRQFRRERRVETSSLLCGRGRGCFHQFDKFLSPQRPQPLGPDMPISYWIYSISYRLRVSLIAIFMPLKTAIGIIKSFRLRRHIQPVAAYSNGKSRILPPVTWILRRSAWVNRPTVVVRLDWAFKVASTYCRISRLSCES